MVLTNLEAEGSLLQAMLDASPAMMLVVDENFRVRACNATASRLVRNRALPRECTTGELLACANHETSPEGCGHAEHCRICPLRDIVAKVRRSRTLERMRAQLEFRDAAGQVKSFYALMTAVPFDWRGQDLVLLDLQDINEMAGLWQILPICSVCKKIRDDQQSWSEVEHYFHEHHDLKFTHGYCPECQEKVLRGEI